MTATMLPLRTEAAAVTWDVARAAPELFEAIRSPALAELVATLRDQVPIAPAIDPFERDGAIRPWRHLRAFYLRLGDEVVAVKGTEPHAPDLAQKLVALRQFRVDYPSRGRSLVSALEHFPLVEQKVPLGVTADEAASDVASACAFQLAHLRAFGELARAPLPLLALRWPAAVAERHGALLLPLLSERAAAIVRPALARGLSCVIYHYPAVPIRVAHLDSQLPSPIADYPSRRRALEKMTDPERTIESWVDLAARMIVLGFLPSTIESHGVGHCLEAQNAVIDGGFVDLGSIKHVSRAADAREIEEALLASVIDLARTVRQFLLGSLADAEAEYRNPSLVMMEIASRVWTRLRERAGEHAIRVEPDPRIAAFFAPGTLFEELDRGLSLLHPPFSVGSEHR
jgi:hypothetical protein